MERRARESRPLADFEWLADLMVAAAALVPVDDDASIQFNAALERMLASESDAGRRRIRQAIHDLADAMRSISDVEREPAFDDRLLRVRSSTRRYVLEPLVAPSRTIAGLVRVHRSRGEVPDPNATASRFGLTRREAEVAMLVATGLSNKSIAAELRLSTHTVRTHIESVFRKVGVTSRAALTARFHQ